MRKQGIVFLMAVCFLCPRGAKAQTSMSSTTGLRRGVAVVMFAGLAGAVLGVSTLSFYGEPQDHIGNIWTGLAAGVLAGGAYVMSQGQRTSMTTESQAPNNPYQVTKMSRPLFRYEFDF